MIAQEQGQRGMAMGFPFRVMYMSWNRGVTA